MLAFMRFDIAELLLFSACAFLVFLNIIQIDEIGSTWALFFQMLFQVFFLIKATLQLAQILILVDIQPFYFGDVLAVAVPDGFRINDSFLEIKHSDVHFGAYSSLS